MKLFDWVTFKEVDEKIPYNGGPYALLIGQMKGGTNMFYIPNCTNGEGFAGIYSMNCKIGYLYDKEITPIKEEWYEGSFNHWDYGSLHIGCCKSSI